MLPRDQSRTPPPHLDFGLDDSSHTRLNGNGSAVASAAAGTFTPNVSTYRPGSAPHSDSEGSEDESEDAMLDAINRDDERGIEETLERLGFGEFSFGLHCLVSISMPISLKSCLPRRARDRRRQGDLRPSSFVEE